MDPIILYYTMGSVSQIEINGISINIPYGAVVRVRTTSWARPCTPVAVPVYSGPEHELNKSELALILTDNKIQAIKDLQERTRIGLREAKAICDQYQDKLTRS